MNRIVITVFMVCALLFATESYASNVSRAKEFMKAGMYPQAIALLEKEIYGDETNQATANPANAEAHYLLGVCLVQNGNFSQADERFASAVKLNPEYGYKIGDVYKDAGKSLLSTGKLAEANELFRKALSYEPSLRKEIALFIFETGKRYGNDELLSLAASYDPGLRKPVAEYYHALSKTAEGDEAKVDLLGIAARYDNTYEGEYTLNREALGRYHLDKAKELARKPGKEAVMETHKTLASKYLGDDVVMRELPEAVVYKPGTYTFSLKAGEQTPYWITFPTGVISNWRLDSPDGKFQAIYDDGEVVNLWSAKSLPKNKYKFRLLAVTDQPEISMVVRQR
ncbi:MAG: tetratricopeptide repeat protein [Thermodesulfobacteriota bacterium]|nr:MAG: tetratricopeptide repeat protein [Thermodesulfobacteriota bacterium]